ncbi:MAG: glycosyltransferase family 1 protein [Rhodothermaceae bacterium]|nr:glycosyltransferase family 1 protein [Rhodothermaceae bacterium]
MSIALQVDALHPSSFGDGLAAGDGLAVRPRRIALFTGNYNHIQDGVSLTLNRLVRHLEASGDQVMVFGPTVEDPPMEHAGTFVPVPSISAPGRPEYRLSVRFPHSLRRQLEAFAPDLVHIATPDYLGIQALRWAKAHDVPVVASYHTHFTSYLKYYGLGVLESALWAFGRWFYNQCAQLYVPSESVGEVLYKHGITVPIHLWTRGIERERFSPVHRSEDWRTAYGLRPNIPVVTFVSRLVWEKGLDVYAQVIEELTDRGIAHHSLVVGDGPAREELEQRLPNAVFVGHLEGEALATAYASSDVFLFPSETETFGNVTLEAMASGVPTVCADAPGSRSLVKNGVTGFLCPPRDAASFYDAVASLVQDDCQRARMGTAARQSADNYDWGAIMDRLRRHYAEVLGTTTVLEPVLAVPRSVPTGQPAAAL